MKVKGKNPQLNHCRNSKFNVTRTRVGEVGKKKEMIHCFCCGFFESVQNQEGWIGRSRKGFTESSICCTPY